MDPAQVAKVGVLTLARLFSRADVLIHNEGEWVLVECKSDAKLREVMNLDYYEQALRRDVVRRPAATDKIKRVFVTDREDARLRELCKQKNIEFVVL